MLDVIVEALQRDAARFKLRSHVRIGEQCESHVRHCQRPMTSQLRIFLRSPEDVEQATRDDGTPLAEAVKSQTKRGERHPTCADQLDPRVHPAIVSSSAGRGYEAGVPRRAEEEIRTLDVVRTSEGGRERGSFDGNRWLMSDQLLQIATALGNPTRLFLLRALGDNGLCLTEAAAAAGIAPSTASFHLDHLVAAGLATKRRVGRRRVYAWPRWRMELVFRETEAEGPEQAEGRDVGSRP